MSSLKYIEGVAVIFNMFPSSDTDNFSITNEGMTCYVRFYKAKIIGKLYFL